MPFNVIDFKGRQAPAFKNHSMPLQHNLAVTLNSVVVLPVCSPCSAYFCLVVCLLNLLSTISWLCSVLHRLKCRGSSLWVCIRPSFPDQCYSLTELGYSSRNSHFIHKEARQDLVLNSQRFKGTLTSFQHLFVITLYVE